METDLGVAAVTWRLPGVVGGCWSRERFVELRLPAPARTAREGEQRESGNRYGP